jgi:CheY-like chemotaxis protein
LLAGGIAHDFNNLLMGILGNAGLSLMEMAPDATGRDSVLKIQDAAQRAAELTKQLLAYSGKGRFVAETISLSTTVEEMAQLLETVVTKGVTLSLDLAPELPAIKGDPTQIRQAIMNLVTNASDAIGNETGVITVSTGSIEADREYLAQTFLDEGLVEGPYAYVEVSDTGCGMDPETKTRIFDPFFTTKFVGRGIGMAAVLGIVRGHKGAIELKSRLDRGTTVRVLFPCCETQSVGLLEVAEPADLEAWQGSGTVLVVDDEEVVRCVAVETLERFGLSVLVAEDGRAGVEMFRENSDQIDLVLLDMAMPIMNGEQAYSALRAIREDVPVILSSGYGEEDTVERFAGKGLAGFVQKPYSPLDLIALIRDVLENGWPSP